MLQAEADEESDDEVRFVTPKFTAVRAEESQEEGAEESDEEETEDEASEESDEEGAEESHDEEQEAGHLLRQGHRFESPEAYEKFVRIPDVDALNNRTSSFDNVFNYLHGLGFLKDAPR